MRMRERERERDRCQMESDLSTLNYIKAFNRLKFHAECSEVIQLICKRVQGHIPTGCVLVERNGCMQILTTKQMSGKAFTVDHWFVEQLMGCEAEMQTLKLKKNKTETSESSEKQESLSLRRKKRPENMTLQNKQWAVRVIHSDNNCILLQLNYHYLEICPLTQMAYSLYEILETKQASLWSCGIENVGVYVQLDWTALLGEINQLRLSSSISHSMGYTTYASNLLSLIPFNCTVNIPVEAGIESIGDDDKIIRIETIDHDEKWTKNGQKIYWNADIQQQIVKVDTHCYEIYRDDEGVLMPTLRGNSLFSVSKLIGENHLYYPVEMQSDQISIQVRKQTQLKAVLSRGDIQ
jgi:hypothetical protein